MKAMRDAPPLDGGRWWATEGFDLARRRRTRNDRDNRPTHPLWPVSRGFKVGSGLRLSALSPRDCAQGRERPQDRRQLAALLRHDPHHLRANDDNGDVANDHYHRYKEDVA